MTRAPRRSRWPVAFGALVLAGLAGACNKTTEPPIAKSTMADSADQTMYGARSLLTDRGLLRAELLSDTAYFFDENTRIELQKVHVTFYATNGAREGWLRVGDGALQPVAYPSTGGFGRIGSITVRIELLVGSNTIEFGGSSPVLDRITVREDAGNLV